MNSNMLKGKNLLVLLATFLLGYMVSLSFVNGPTDVHADASFKANDVPLTRIDGSKTSLGKYRGKWVLLNFWATWCPPCVEEMPSLNEFHNIFKDKNMVVLAVSLDKADGSVVKKFVKEYELEFQIFHDPKGLSTDGFDISGLPTTYLISPDGEVVSHAIGGRNWADPSLIDYFKGKMNGGS